jgi:diadenylate cyclase
MSPHDFLSRTFLPSELAQFAEVLLLWVMFFYLFRLLRGTRGAEVLTGLVLILVLMLVLTQVLNFYILNWLFTQFSGYLVIACVIIFQPELRRLLAELGKQHVFSSAPQQLPIVEQIVEAADQLAAGKIGGLMAIERETGTRHVQESGVPLDAEVSAELLTSIFYPRSPLHDGGVVIRGTRVAAARCVFPLTQRDEVVRSLGTRHRAAIGLTEESDAIVVVVSEETGVISIAYRGRLSRGLDKEKLRRMLHGLLRRRRPVEAALGGGSTTTLFQTQSGEGRP